MVAKIGLSEFRGIYVVPEAALYLTATLKRDVPAERLVYRIRARNMIHWIRVGLVTRELRDVAGRELVIGFEELISMRVIAILRALGVSWTKIRRAEDWLRVKTGYPRPFAVERVWTETTDVFAEFHEGLVAASRCGQLVFKSVLGQYLQSVHDMIFVQHDGIRVAAAWMPHRDVLLNPRIQFGEPCIKDTRVRTRVVWQLFSGGESKSYIARSFGVSEEQIEHALEWEDRLQAARTC